PGFNLAGWNESYTGAPFSEEEMREWVDHTIGRILALGPRRVLEIGCGTGLLLLQIAPHVEYYCGTDLSREALACIEAQIAGADTHLPIELLHRQADDFNGVEPRSFDLVVLNSVVQYFPSIDYLLRIIEQAARSVKTGGHIFVGDVRSLPLLEAFHASVQLHQAQPWLNKAQLRTRVQKRLSMEQELAIAPRFFLSLSERVSEIAGARCSLKRGTHPNELNSFRYDVVIEIGGQTASSEGPIWIDWQTEGLTLDSLEALLNAEQQETVAIKSVPNARVREHVRALELLESADGSETARDIREALARAESNQGIDPEAVGCLAESLGYQADIGWTGDDREGLFEAIFTKPGREIPGLSAPRATAAPPLGRCANHPVQEMLSRKLIPELREHARASLPSHMVPATFVTMPELPMTPNGKVDRRSLPAPELGRPEMEQAYVGPRTEPERIIAEIWEEFLGVAPVGVHDNFFELGGDSLLSIQVTAKAIERGLPLTSKQLFEHQTIAKLAALLRTESVDESALDSPDKASDAETFGWTQNNLDEIAAAIAASLNNESSAD
ncbi:MAG TPA: methyltransferase, partial [Blastocatellia bacterium]|nr:methyltransferase [Blastocatellia bacterium]